MHPHVIGQPQRTRYFDLALASLKSFSDVWFANGRQIAEHYLSESYDAVQARIAAFKDTGQ